MMQNTTPSKEQLINAYQRVADKIRDVEGRSNGITEQLWDKLQQLDALLLEQDMSPEEVIQLYRSCKAWASDYASTEKVRVAYFEQRLDRLENKGLELAQSLHTETFTTNSGTMYRHKKKYLKITDWGSALQSIVAQALQFGGITADIKALMEAPWWGFLNHALSKEQCVTFREENKRNWPGTEISEEFAMGFRAPSRKRTKAAEAEQAESVEE